MIKRRLLLVMFTCLILAFSIPQTNMIICKAETDYSWLTKKPDKQNKQGKMFQKYINNFKVQARSLYKILAIFFMTAVVCATIFSGTSLTLNSKGEKRKDWQMKLVHILIVLIVFFSMTSIFMIAEEIGKTIFLAKKEG